MSKSMPTTPPLASPLHRSGGSQGAFDFSTVADWNDGIYSCAQAACEEYGSVDALAAELGISRQLTALRLTNARDSKGDVQKLRLDELAHLLADPRARWRFLTELSRICQARPPEPLRQLSAEEKLRLIASELPERRRRQLEREHGIPTGGLEP